MRFTALGEGKHRFTVSAIDQASNRDAMPAYHEWKVDLRPPSKPRIIGPRTTRSRRPTYRFLSRDSVTARDRLRFRCALDSRRLQPCPAVYRRRLAPATHVLYAAAVDEAGRASAVAHTRITVLRRP